MKQSKVELAKSALVTCVASVFLLGVSMAALAGTPKDGDLPVPAGYQNWYKFVDTVEKPNGQIREIYINDVGIRANKGDAFPYGTVSVMEIYTSKKKADGSLAKDKLSKVFVMGKGAGWGQSLPADNMPNGEWVYSAYKADAKTPATNDFKACRSCHAPLQSTDYIARYDEHFEFKK